MIKRLIITGLVMALVSNLAICQTKKYSDHYYKRVNQFNSEPAVNSKSIVMLGDSLTEGGDWESYFRDILPEGYNIVNRGIVGDDAIGMYDRLEQIIPGQPYKIFLLVGINDISHNITSDSVLIDINRVVKEIVTKSPNTKLYIQSLLPFNEPICKYKSLMGKTHTVRRVNKGLKRLSKRYNLKYINLYDRFKAPNSIQLDEQFTKDGLHINKAGYTIWANAIKKYIK